MKGKNACYSYLLTAVGNLRIAYPTVSESCNIVVLTSLLKLLLCLGFWTYQGTSSWSSRLNKREAMMSKYSDRSDIQNLAPGYYRRNQSRDNFKKSQSDDEEARDVVDKSSASLVYPLFKVKIDI